MAWKQKAEGTYLAPYFPIIQSSGMGKTKLLFEYKQRMANMTEENTTKVLMLC
jgi:hypothetical protein